MKKLITFATISVGGIALLFCTTMATGCGGKKKDQSPEGLCKTIYKERIDGPIKIFKESGPKNKVAFMKHCQALPAEYLKCEAKDMMKMGEGELKTCKGLIMTHQKGLNDVLMTGKVMAK